MPLANCGEQRDDKTNHYKSMKGEEDLILVQNPLVPWLRGEECCLVLLYIQ